MNQLTLKQLFGENISQDSQVLVIKKSDLPLLTPLVSNTATSLVAGILLKVLENYEGCLTTETGEEVTDELGNRVTYNNGDLFLNLYVFLWKSYIADRGNFFTLRNSLIIQSFTEME